MKKQTAAVMSAVTLISSVNVPVVPAFAMENQEQVQEIIEQNETEQIVVPVAEDGVGEEVFEEATEEATQDVIEVTEITNEEIKEGEMNEGTTEEVNQETDSEELTEDFKEEVITEESTEEVVVEGQETEDVLIGTENPTESEGENKELDTEVQMEEEVEIPDINLKSAINRELGRAEDSAITKVDLLGLTQLVIYSNEIVNLAGLEYATNLTSLYVDKNQISDLKPLSNLTNLTSLYLDNNQISDFSPVDHVDYLGARNQVISLAPERINKGDSITINNPLLGEVFERYGTYDEIITISPGKYDQDGNQLTWENVTTHHLQFTFKSPGAGNVSGVIIVPVEFMDGEVEEEIVTIPDTSLQALINKMLGRLDDPTHAITKGEMEQITELISQYDEITNLTGLEYAINLTNLSLYNTQVSDLSPVVNLTNLKNLQISSNQITDLEPIANLTNLTDLYLGSNQISDLSSLANLTNLTSLSLDSNQISDLSPIANLTNLTSLSLTYLSLDSNQISDLSPLANLTNLTYLYLDNNQISDLSPLANLTNLTDLYLGSNQISDLRPLAKLTSLELLGLSGNQISDLSPIAKLTSLELLSLSGNQISDLSPLANLMNLTELYLDDNIINDISVISNLKNLNQLILYGNQIKDLTPLDTLSSLEQLDIGGQEIKLNPIYVQPGGTVVINNPLIGEWWNMKAIWDETTIYDIGFRVENGYYDAENKQFVWENVKDSSLTFSFSNSQYNFEDRRGGSTRGYMGWNQVSGTVTIPVVFYEVPDAFSDFVSNDVFNIIGGTGAADDPLVLEVVNGTEIETVKSLLAKYSDYDLTVTKKVTKEKAATTVESYLLTFTKGEEQATFEVHVPTTETDIINYLNSLIEQPEQPGDQSGQQPEQPGDQSGQQSQNKPVEQKPVTTTPNVTKPTTQQNATSQHPQTGMSGFMGIIGVGALSLAAVITRRKKK